MEPLLITKTVYEPYPKFRKYYRLIMGIFTIGLALFMLTQGMLEPILLILLIGLGIISLISGLRGRSMFTSVNTLEINDQTLYMRKHMSEHRMEMRELDSYAVTGRSVHFKQRDHSVCILDFAWLTEEEFNRALQRIDSALDKGNLPSGV